MSITSQPFDEKNLTPDQIDALLGRLPLAVENSEAASMTEGKTILVTGAGGTIGSELARQLLALAPAKILMADQSEYNLYALKEELSRSYPEADIRYHLVNIGDEAHLNALFTASPIDMIYHAAAYKHVPIVEENKCIAALVNVNGAANVFRLAVAHRVGCLVFISTDKAVNPTSFMGATKRLSELYAQGLDAAQKTTRFVTVRFGNVLGSTGSVIPLFAEQIRRGGPLSVTHPDVARYFMTSSEAAKLILAAASLKSHGMPKRGGRVFMLDMGAPIKIQAMAEKLIRCFGLKPHEDIAIEYCGLRPGEKLFEELFLKNEQTTRTSIKGVMIASAPLIDLPLLSPKLDKIQHFARLAMREPLEKAITDLIPDYTPSQQRKNTAQEAARASVHSKP